MIHKYILAFDISPLIGMIYYSITPVVRGRFYCQLIRWKILNLVRLIYPNTLVGMWNIAHMYWIQYRLKLKLSPWDIVYNVNIWGQSIVWYIWGMLILGYRCVPTMHWAWVQCARHIGFDKLSFASPLFFLSKSNVHTTLSYINIKHGRYLLGKINPTRYAQRHTIIAL